MPNQVVYTFLANDRFTRPAKAVAKQTRAIRTQLARLGPIAKRTSRIVVSAFGKMKVAARGFLTSGLGPLVAAFAGIAGIMKFFTIGSGFQDAMADLSAITGATGKDLAFLREQTLKLGKESKTSAAEVAAGFKLVGSAKPELLKTPKALAQVTEQVLLLKNASGLDLPVATNTAVKSLNAFNQGADQAARFVNVLAAGSKFGASEVEDIGLALKNVGPVAAIAGINFETTNAALQVLALNSQVGAEAGTGLRGTLLKLNKAIPFDRVGGFANALEILASKNLSLIQLQEIFGEEMVKSGAVLVKNVPLLRQLTKQVTGTNAASEQAAIRLGTLSAKARGLGVTIANKLIRTFDRLAPQFDDVILKADTFFGTITTEDVAAFANQIKDILKIIVALGKIIFGLFTLLTPFRKLAVFALEVAAATVLGILNKVESGIELLKSAKEFFVGAATAGGGPGTLKTIDPGVTSKFKAEISLGVNDPKEVIGSVKVSSSGEATLRTGINREGQL